MNKFETYLIDNGIHFQVAGKYGLIADKYIQWLKANNLKARNVKRSKFLEWIEECRAIGNKERTIIVKENVIKHYYYFLGTKNNPALTFLKKRRAYTLPPPAIEKAELLKIYENLKPKSPVEYRNRCMLGMVLFQALKRSELTELRIQDIDFEGGFVFIQEQLTTNSRRLKLQPMQILHLYDYLNKYRKEFLSFKENAANDKFYLAKGKGSYLNNALTRVLADLRRSYPHIKDLLHIRGSVITNWQKDKGIMEAMVNAGHRYISSTARYETTEYEELSEQLKIIHPLENMNLNSTFGNH